jgi:hypothetical protein
MSWFSCSFWTFGIAISVALWFGFCICARAFRTASMRYLVLCGIVLSIFAFSHFGLKSRFTADTIPWYFPHSPATPNPTPPQN